MTAAAVIVGSTLAGAAAQAPASVEARRAALTKLLAEEWEYELKEGPEAATIYGDYRYNDKVSDYSPAHQRQLYLDSKRWLARFQAIDTTGFPEQEALNQQLMIRNYKEGIEGYDLKLWEMPINQMNGIHLEIAQFVAIVPFNTTKQYDDWLARLRQVPTMLAQTEATCELGRKDGLMPPRFLLEKIPTQARAIEAPAGDKSVFATPLGSFPASVSAADQKRLREQYIAVIDQQVRPAYAKFADYIEKTYAPAGRLNEGMWSLPNGDALYRYM